MAENDPDTVDAAEVARLLGTSRRNALALATTRDFPPSLAESKGRRLWPRDKVQAWAASRKHDARPYRPPELRTPARGAGWMLTGLTPHLYSILELARAEAMHVNDTGIGPDHLLLALLHPDCPGASRQVLESLGLRLDDMRASWETWLGDPHTPRDGEVELSLATRLALERAKLEAIDLRDEVVSSEHVLLDLIESSDRDIRDVALAKRLIDRRWLADAFSMWRLLRREGPPNVLHLGLYPGGLALEEIRPRVLALTEDPGLELRPASPFALRPEAIELEWSGQAPRFVRSPLGHDPQRRRPWHSAAFVGEDGSHLAHGRTLLQYRVDRDGYPVVTDQGQFVALLKDDAGNLVWDERGRPIQTAIGLPAGAKHPARVSV